MRVCPNRTRFPLAVLCVAADLLMPAASSAATLFTSEASFLSALAPGYYLEDFESLPGSHGQLPGPQLFSGGTPLFSCEVDTTHSWPDSSLWLTTQGTKAISVALSWDDLVVTLTGAKVTAIGGNFFLSAGEYLAGGDILLRLNDGTTVPLASSADPSGRFRGFTTTAPNYITQLTVHCVTELNAFATMDHLYVGSVIPEPATGLLTALAGLLACVCPPLAASNGRDRGRTCKDFSKGS